MEMATTPKDIGLEPSGSDDDRILPKRRTSRRKKRITKYGNGDVVAAREHLLVVLIPALNEQETIGKVIGEIPPANEIPGIDAVKVVVVDDGSNDETAIRAWRAGATDVIRHPGSRGLAAVFDHGVTEALSLEADIVVTLDGDGQHDPTELAHLVEPIVRGEADIVVGARPLGDSSQGSLVRRLGNRLGSWLVCKMLDEDLTDLTSGYRAFSREALTRLHVSSRFTYTLDTLIQASGKRLRMTEVQIPARDRVHGESRMTHSIIRYVGHTANQAFRTAFHLNPLRIMGRTSAFFAVAAVGMTVWFLLSYANGGSHLPSLLAVVLLTLMAGGLLVCGLLADGINSNRRLLEDVLYRLKRSDVSSEYLSEEADEFGFTAEESADEL
jgi:glycosyltransferase involved in cell wall biosynthesis